MITGIVEIKDFLQDPDETVKVAKSCSFYSLENHPKTLDQDDKKLSWQGMRSDSLYKFDKPLSDFLFNRLFCKIAEKAVGGDKFGMSYEYYGNSSFHYFTEDNVLDSSWVHNDEGSLFAGVLYLNKDAPENTGTVVIDDNPVVVKNEYNKLVLYPAHFKHYAQGGFGKDVNDARLSIVFFISSVSFRLNCA